MIKVVDAGRAIPLGPSMEQLTPSAVSAVSPASGPEKLALCAPHPDDEAIGGSLALRLLRESGASVTSIAVTLGRDKGQQERRLREVQSACHALGFKFLLAHPPSGLDDVTQSSRLERPAEWRTQVNALREIFDSEQPDAVMMPHVDDFNTTHVGTHWLALDALGEHLEQSGRGPVLLIETEFWHEMENPNLMVGLAPELVAAQLVGIGEHGDEMRRNPYHLLHPCRLMDNVRRGSEVVGGQGAAARDFAFAEIYNLALMKGRERLAAPPGGCIIDPNEKFSLARLKSQFWPQGV
ncbi:MAG: PIG-L deacetylase family protein [Terriglobia bacterium]